MPHIPTLCVDFDGVMHSYTSGWVSVDVVSDPPVEGAFAWLEEMVTAGFRVCIFSARSNKPEGIEAMKRWFQKHELPDWLFACLAFPTTKPGALLYIDDRGFHFEGEFPTVDYIRKFKPWNKR